MPDHNQEEAVQAPGYALDDELELDQRQMRVLLEPTRARIIELLGERAGTTSELAEALDKPKGTVGYHCKMLEDHGLITVVRTEQVRAIEAKYYGRTARTFVFNKADGAFTPEGMLGEAAAEINAFRASHPGDEAIGITSVRYARIPDERAEEWAARLAELIDEFTRQARGGDQVYGLAAALFPTIKKTLPSEEQS
jgi:DNA-binding transcriptional ArsR family regulator